MTAQSHVARRCNAMRRDGVKAKVDIERQRFAREQFISNHANDANQHLCQS